MPEKMLELARRIGSLPEDVQEGIVQELMAQVRTASKVMEILARRGA